MALTDVTNSDAPTQVDLGPPQPLQLPPYYVAAPGMASQPAPEPVQQPQVVDRQAYWTNQWDQMRQQNEALQAQRKMAQDALQQQLAPVAAFMPQVSNVLEQNRRGQVWNQQAEWDAARQNPNLDAEAAGLVARGDRQGYALYQRANASDATPQDITAYQQHLATHKDSATLGEQVLGKVYEAARTDIPYAGEAAGVTGFLGRRAGQGLFAGPLDKILPEGYRPGEIAGKVGEEVGNAVAPREAWQGVLELLPGIGSVPGGISAVRKTIAEAGPVAEEYLASAAGRAVLQKLASESGHSTPGDMLLGLDRLLQRPAFLKNDPLTRTPFLPKYIDPPDLRRLGMLTPEEALAKAKAESGGGVVRAVGEHVADVLNPPVQAGKTGIGTRITTWISKEAERLTRPLAEARAQYERNIAAGTKWAHEQGARLAESVSRAYGADPYAPFRSRATGAAAKVVGDDGLIHELTNLDVAENWQHFADILTPEQITVAREHGRFLSKLRDAARADGVRIGSAQGPFGELDSYIPRPATGKEGKPFYSDSEHGLTAESARDYKTQAEGLAHGVDYKKTWAENYAPSLSALQRRRAELELKKWSDLVGETPTQRMARLMPNQVAERNAARDALANAESLQKKAISGAHRRAVNVAAVAVRKAQNAVRNAERVLATATRAPTLEKTVLHQQDVVKVGAVRERFVTATTAVEDWLKTHVSALGPDANAIGRARQKAVDAASELIRAHEEGDATARRLARYQLQGAQRSLADLTRAPALEARGVSDRVPAALMREQEVARQALVRHTLAGQLEATVGSRASLVNSVGRAREVLRARTAELKAASSDAVDSLKGYVDPQEQRALDNLKELVAHNKERNKDAGAAFRAAVKRTFKLDETKEVRNPRMIAGIGMGRIFSVEDAKALEQATPAEQGLVGAIWQAAQMPYRTAKLTLDTSAAGVQGWVTLLSHPLIWAHSVLDGALMTANPKLRALVLDRDPELLRWSFKNMPEVIDNNPDYIQAGGMLTKFGRAVEARTGGVTKVVSKPLGLVDQLFRDTRTSLALNLARSMRDMAKNPDQEYELGSAITKLVGMSRGVGPEKDVLLAANQMRALIGTVLDAGINGGIQGKVARETLLRAFGAAASATLAWHFANGERDPRELVRSITPGEQGAFNIAGVDLMGTYSPYIRTLATAGGASKDFAQSGDVSQFGEDVLGRKGALTQLGRGKLNPVLGGTVSTLTGRDYLGRPTSLAEQFAGVGSVTPLSVGAIRQNVDKSNFWLAVPAIIGGARYNPPSAYRDLTDTLKNLNVPESDFFEPGTRRQLIAEYPELQRKYDEWRNSRESGTVGQQQAEKIARDKTMQIQQVLDAVHNGNMQPDELRAKIRTINELSNAIREATLPEPEARGARLEPLYAFYDAPENQDPAGGPDFQKVNDAIEAKLKENPELRAPWEANQFVPVTNDPLEIALKNAQRLVNTASTPYPGDKQATWFGATDLIWDDVRRSLPFTKDYATYGDWQDHIAAEAHKEGVDVSVLQNIDQPTKLVASAIKGYHLSLLSKDPKLGAALMLFYGVDLPNKDMGAALSNAIGEEERKLYAMLGIEQPQ